MSVKIVVLTKTVSLVFRCLLTIIEKTSFLNYSIDVVLHNVHSDRIDDFADRVKFYSYNGKFNFSTINNWMVGQSGKNSDFILFLNDDTTVISESWLGSMIELFRDERVAVVGAKLLYPDNSIQHAGLILGRNDVSGKNTITSHWHKHLPNSWGGYRNAPHTIREVSAVTGACMMVRREIFEKVGGFDENLAVAFNDVDFCLKVRAAGYKVIYAPNVVLYHHESLSRGSDRAKKNRDRLSREIAYMKKKWSSTLDQDPFMDSSLIPNPKNPFIRLRSVIYTRLFSKQWFRPLIPYILPLLRIKGMGF